uniref:Uncharacterized protein n=1 Tax=Parascaris univalens TaxID=6257 RepID=A0A915C8X5_PARUN
TFTPLTSKKFLILAAAFISRCVTRLFSLLSFTVVFQLCFYLVRKIGNFPFVDTSIRKFEKYQSGTLSIGSRYQWLFSLYGNSALANHLGNNFSRILPSDFIVHGLHVFPSMENAIL